MPRPTIVQLIAAQEAANLSDGAVARAIGKDRSTVGRHKSGEAELSVEMAEAWAEACGGVLAVVTPHVAAVSALVTIAEDLTMEELHLLERAAAALLSSRGDPSARAVVLAGLGLVSGQVKDAAARLKVV